MAEPDVEQQQQDGQQQADGDQVRGTTGSAVLAWMTRSTPNKQPIPYAARSSRHGTSQEARTARLTTTSWWHRCD
jgi:hypothetical protein